MDQAVQRNASYALEFIWILLTEQSRLNEWLLLQSEAEQQQWIEEQGFDQQALIESQKSLANLEISEEIKSNLVNLSLGCLSPNSISETLQSKLKEATQELIQSLIEVAGVSMQSSGMLAKSTRKTQTPRGSGLKRIHCSAATILPRR